MDNAENRQIGVLFKSAVFIISILLLMPFVAYSDDVVSPSYKHSTLDYIRQVKDSLGIDGESMSERVSVPVEEQPEAIMYSEYDEEVSEIEVFEAVEDIKKSQQLGIESDLSLRRTNVEYLGTSQKEIYPAEEKGPNVVTRLDPYHPKHEDFKVPYYKDREGLKIHPWVGVRGEYKQDEQLVGIESLIMEAKELNQSTDEELRDYISSNDKHYTRGELILHYKETWPKFTFIHHNERVTRQYEAKKLWSSNDIYYDNYDRKYYKLNYTIPNLPYIGYLDITARYGANRLFRPNDNVAYSPFDSYLLTLKCMPIYDAELKVEGLYVDGDFPRSLSVDNWKERHLFLELKKKFPRQYLTIIPHYEWEDEEHFPVTGNSEWVTHKAGVRLEKEINGKLEFKTDWTHINHARDKDRDTILSDHISVRALTIENDLIYEVIRDLKFTLGFDYGAGLDSFNGFDNYTIRGELMYRKPGLADWRFGIRHTEYFNIDDEIDTVYFKIGLFM